MTLSPVTVGALIHEQIKIQEQPKILKSIPIPTIIPKGLSEAQIEAKLFTYDKYEIKTRDETVGRAAKGYHEGAVAESITHCLHKRNMSVIKDPSIIHHLRESNFWNELNTYGNKTHRFDNVTMASTIWRYRGKWIISSHSAYLKIMDGDI